MTDPTNNQPVNPADYGQGDPPQPSDRLRSLDRLVGTWAVTGGAEGTVRYEWMPGGHFLVQHVELEQYGQAVTGLEVIGHLHPFGEPMSEEVAAALFAWVTGLP